MASVVVDDRLTVLLVEETTRPTPIWSAKGSANSRPSGGWTSRGTASRRWTTSGGRAATHAPRPALIPLDLKLPGKGGHEALRQIKEDRALRRIPVVVFSSSGAQRDIALCYDVHANCCLANPGGLDDFVAIPKAIETFWLGTIELPRM